MAETESFQDETPRQRFDRICNEKFVLEKATSNTHTRKDIETIGHVLKGEFEEAKEKIDPINRSQKLASMKYRIKCKGYVYIQGVGVVMPIKDDLTNGYRKVIAVEDFWDVLTSIHESTGHASIHSTLNKLKDEYAGIPRSAAQIFAEECTACKHVKQKRYEKMTTRPAKKKNIGPPQEIFENVQVGFVDMPELDRYKYILHAVDAASHFHFLWPIQFISQDEVYAGLTHMFSITGVPDNLHFDSIFQGLGIENSMTEWKAKCNVYYGVKENQKTVDKFTPTIQDLLKNFPHRKWHDTLPHIMYQLNTTYCSAIKKSPYNMVYRRKKPTPGSQTEDETEMDDHHIENQTFLNQEASFATSTIQDMYSNMPVPTVVQSSTDFLHRGPQPVQVIAPAADGSTSSNDVSQSYHNLIQGEDDDHDDDDNGDAMMDDTVDNDSDNESNATPEKESAVRVFDPFGKGTHEPSANQSDRQTPKREKVTPKRTRKHSTSPSNAKLIKPEFSPDESDEEVVETPRKKKKTNLQKIIADVINPVTASLASASKSNNSPAAPCIIVVVNNND